MYILNITNAIKKMTVNEIKYSIFENKLGFLKKTAVIQ